MANLQIIRDLSERKQVTLRAVANRINISEDGLQKIIRKGSTNTTTLEKIAQVLDVPVGIFFDDTPLNQISQTGTGNVVGNRNQVTISDCENKLELAEQKNLHLQKLLEEKERTIQILLTNKTI